VHRAAVHDVPVTAFPHLVMRPHRHGADECDLKVKFALTRVRGSRRSVQVERKGDGENRRRA
jgi:hypothetical protein